MDALLKPFVALATSWKSDQFFKARLKLALLYVLIVSVIIVGVSAIFYVSAKNQIESFPRRFSIQAQVVPGRLPIIEINNSQEEAIRDIENQIISNLFTVDVSIIVLVFILGYWWAGKTLRPIKNLLEQQKRFIGDASHELRTPLAVMKTCIDVFEQHEKATTVPIRELLSTIRQEVNSLSLMTTQLLDLSRADSADLVYSVVSVTDVITQVYHRFAILAQEKKITLTKQVEEGLFVRGDKNALEHAFANIVDNAIKYTPPSGSVTVSAEHRDDTVTIRFTDTGQGINDADIPHIFNRFYQSDTSKHTAGVGLGLSIVKAIIDRHAGTVVIESTVGQGTTFIVSLPTVIGASEVSS